MRLGSHFSHLRRFSTKAPGLANVTSGPLVTLEQHQGPLVTLRLERIPPARVPGGQVAEKPPSTRMIWPVT